MKKSLKKTISLVLVLVLSFTICVPAFAKSTSSDKTSNQSTISYQQKLKQLQIVRESLKDTPELNVKLNKENQLEIYTDEVAKINAKAAASGGLVYGPWFGGVSSYYSESFSETLTMAAALASLLIPFLNSEEVAVKAASGILGYLGWTVNVTPGEWVAADRRKCYREVKYSDGTFAYFQTKVGANVKKAGTQICDNDTIISGGMW